MNARDTRRMNVVVFGGDFGTEHPEVFASAKGRRADARRSRERPGGAAEPLPDIARSCVTNATPIADAPAARGMPQATLTNLPAQIDALDQTMIDQSRAKEAHVGVRAGIEARFKSAMATIKAMDAIVTHGPQRDPQLLAAWKNKRRMGPAHPKEPTTFGPVPVPESKSATNAV